MKSAEKTTHVGVVEAHFYNNTVGGATGSGGAISAAGSSMSFIIDGTVSFEENSAAQGGALEAINGAEVMIIDAVFSSNKAGQGGALFGQVCLRGEHVEFQAMLHL